MSKKIKITALVLAVVLSLCVIIAAVIVLPQFGKKGKRYDDTKNIANGSVQMIAHRGLSGLALENTLFAFEAAGERGYYGIEADVQITKDGKFIIAHDSDLQRIVGLDMQISESSFAELRALRFSDIYGSSDEKNCFLPSLDEYINICKKYDKQAVLELKNTMPKEKVLELAQAVQALGWWERTTFISFRRNNLLALREGFPDATAQYIVEKAEKADFEFMIEHKIDANLCWSAVTPSRVRKLHKAGLKVNCWTVDGRACAWYMRACGVDMITTNILE